MVVKIEFILIATILILISLVSAQGQFLTITSEKSIYIPGDTIKVQVTVYNPNPNTANVKLYTFLENYKKTYPMGIIPFEFQLSSKETKTILIYDIPVDKDFISDIYKVSAVVFFDKEEIKREYFEFEVKDTFKEMQVEIKLCKDKSCKQESRIFMKNEEIYLDYDSNVKNPTITTIIKSPDRKTQKISLPTSIKADQIGTYELEITASKEDYKTITKTDRFAVIEKQVEIQSISVCNNDGTCSKEENYQNCPQDCPLVSKDKIISKKGTLNEFIKKNKVTLTIVLGVLAFILLVIFILYLISKKKKNPTFDSKIQLITK